jgi:hypothetical protein
MELIATEPAFYKGRRLRPGQEFTFDGDKPPKWAAPKDKAVLKPQPMAADTRPLATQKAVKKKIGEISEAA